MKLNRIALLCALFGCNATAALAQTGLYGSPEPILLAPMPAYPADNSVSPDPAVHVFQTSATAPGDDSVPLAPLPAPNGQQPTPSPIGELLTEPTPPIKLPALDDPGNSSAPAGATANDAAAAGGYSTGCSPDCCSGSAIMPKCGFMAGLIGCGCDCDGCGCCSPWYVHLRALAMTRDQPNTVYTSAEANNLDIQGSFDTFNWSWGGEATIGYQFGCCCEYAIEGTFWSPGLMQSDGGPGIPGPYVTPMTFGLTNILGPNGAVIGTGNQWTDQSPDHHIWRTEECYDFELNFWRNHILGNDCSCWNLGAMVGFRYFEFRDRFLFGAERANDGSAYAGDWLYLNDDVKNQLAGVQIGFDLDWNFAKNWKLFVQPKFGVFDNHINVNYDVYAIGSATGQRYQGSSSTYSSPNYPVSASTDSFSILSQIDVGVDWQITRHIGAEIGYRVVGVTGVGLSDNQIPFYANDTPAIANVQKNGSLVLNGAFAGLTITF